MPRNSAEGNFDSLARSISPRYPIPIEPVERFGEEVEQSQKFSWMGVLRGIHPMYETGTKVDIHLSLKSDAPMPDLVRTFDHLARNVRTSKLSLHIHTSGNADGLRAQLLDPQQNPKSTMVWERKLDP